MTNAKKEIIDHVGQKEVELVRIVIGRSYSSEPQREINGDMESVLNQLDFEYVLVNYLAWSKCTN